MRLKETKAYLILISILVAGFCLFIGFSYSRLAQMGITIALSAAYVIWGIYYHWSKKELHPKVIVEYLVIALLASVLVISLLLRA